MTNSNRDLVNLRAGKLFRLRAKDWPDLLLLPLALLLMIVFVVAIFVAVVGLPLWLTLLLLYSKYRKLTAGHPIHWLRTKLGWGKSVQKLAERLGVTIDELESLTPTYREAFVPKNRGGVRRLLVPDEATMAMQRTIVHRLLRRLRAHAAATGFELGRSIVDNALPHVGQAVVIQMDIQDFFPHTTEQRVDAYYQRIGWNREAASLLTKLTTHEGGLPQGAPTSPRLSNLVNYGIDLRLARLAARRKGRYTRYADDITFSFPKDYPKRVRGIIQLTRRILKVYGYAIHETDKLHIRRRHQRQMVTGLVVNERVNLPRKVRRRLRAAMHRHRAGGNATWTFEQLQGWSGLLAMIDQKQRPHDTDD